MKSLRAKFSSSPVAADELARLRLRLAEAEEFYSFEPATLSADAKNVQRQALAGLLWSKQ